MFAHSRSKFALTLFRRFACAAAYSLAPVAACFAFIAFDNGDAQAQLKPLPSAMRPATEFVGPSVTRPMVFAEPRSQAIPAAYENAAAYSTIPSSAPSNEAIVAVPIGQATFAPSGEETGIFEPIHGVPTTGGTLSGTGFAGSTVIPGGAAIPGSVDGDESQWYFDHEPWTVQFFPNGLVYRSYLAGVKEPRFGVQIFHEKNDGWLWDVTLGGRVGLLRYGTTNVAQPEGFQIDMEGAAFPRLDPESQMDLNAADFRFGIPFTYGVGKWQVKFAYYHLSSHLGDEYVFRNNLTTRYNYARDAIVLGLSYFVLPSVRLYAEADWAFYQDVARPWAFQFGAEYSPQGPTGMRGTPFVALNGHLRQELDFSGNVVAQAGWQWRSTAGHLMRVGLHYYNGLNPQFALFDDFEEQIGAGLWYDY